MSEETIQPDMQAEPPQGTDLQPEPSQVADPSAPAEAPAGACLQAADVAAIEAILFATDNPISAAKIVEVADLSGGRKIVRQAIDALNERYEKAGCAFRIEGIAGGYQMLTLPEFNDILKRLLNVRDQGRLSQAALETLAIVAYKQPILRADVEAIRGVSSGEMIRSLMEKGLVKIVGRAEEIGRPMLYGTTRKFLEVFGMKDLNDLPQVEQLVPPSMPPPMATSAEKPAAEAPVPPAAPEATPEA